MNYFVPYRAGFDFIKSKPVCVTQLKITRK